MRKGAKAPFLVQKKENGKPSSLSTFSWAGNYVNIILS